nr:unnamed protein product [Callosobruchus analis]
MEYKVDDFFNEINEIAPPKQVVSKDESVWKQCHDELTGYSYYWNTETDEVTWQAPTSFKPLSKKDTVTPKDPPQHPLKAKSNLYVPPKTPLQPPGAVKIYSIGECSQQTFKIADSKGGGNKKKKKTKLSKDKDSVLKKFLGRDSESEDEKIELITSYGGDTDSEPEEPPPKKNKPDPQESDHNEDEEEELDILSQIKKAQALKNISESKKKDISDSKKPKTTVKENNFEKQAKNVPGLKLVAGYSDSDSEEEEPHEPVVVSKPFIKPESHSTLFPITEPIDIKDFASPKTEIEEKAPTQAEFIDSKLFQRKKRIGVALVNSGKKKEDAVEGDGERKGLGFSTSESQPSQPNSNVYPGFAKGGVMFVKTDVLQPSVPAEPAAVKEEKNNEEDVANKKLVKDMYQTLQEKLGFLNVGAGAVSPVYTMIIQSEILYNAMNEGGLKLSYLQKWLKNTCTELVNLEKEATPEGWLLQWDRKNKRYYYENLLTGVSQWEYPVEEEALPPQLPAPKPQSPPPPPSDDDAMDICTTPPPPPEDPQEVATVSPPPPPPAPPVISCPSPPPPPIISRLEGDKGRIQLPATAPPLPPPPPDTPYPDENIVNKKDSIEQQQPLPPGVDVPPPPPPGEPPEPPKEVQQAQPKESPGDPLNSALNSFYSDIAALGSDLITPPSSALPAQAEIPAEKPNNDQAVEGVKKKKKAKVKLAAGITLKKKGVTQLVEKWNTLQNSYD